MYLIFNPIYFMLWRESLAYFRWILVQIGNTYYLGFSFLVSDSDRMILGSRTQMVCVHKVMMVCVTKNFCPC
jgi:hypothetical protein